MTLTWHERAVAFGPDRAMVGVLTAPDAGGGDTAVLLLNAGVIHRVGPNRINVVFARDIAGLGLPVLRFDQSGLGDSAPRDQQSDLHASVEQDISDAMAYMADNHGATKFVLIGICSGARAALRACYRLEGITASIVVDPPVFKTARAVVGHFAPRLLSADSWKTALSGKNQRIKGAIDRLRGRTSEDEPESAASETTMPDRLPEWPSKDDMTQALAKIVGNGTSMLWIYTGGAADDQYNYRDQLRDAFPDACASGLVDWELMGDVDHDFATAPSRDAIREQVCSWIKRRGLTG